jgi:putative NIF3 family GTP cyclohydrolase 1 type 2
LNTNDLREHLLANAPWVGRESTVDTVKFGDPTRPIRSVAVGWYPSLGSLRAAAALGCELFVTHEPLFWEHRDPPDHPNRSSAEGAARAKVLEDGGMAVLRCHDAWDQWPGIGIRDSWAAHLGLARRVAEEGAWHAAYDIEPQPLRRFAAHVAARVAELGEDSVQGIGDPDRIVRRAAVGVGCAVPGAGMIAAGADVLIVCYDGASYWQRRQRFAEMGAAVISVEHGTSEIPGIANLARYLAGTFRQLTVHHIEEHERTWTVKANG